MRGRPLLPALVAGLAVPCAVLANAGTDGEAWVRFDDVSSVASARPIVASDVPGDATLAALSVDDGMLHVDGALGLERGSRWATLGAEIAPDGIEAGVDLSGAGMLRIRLASAVARPLRVRIKGSDREIGNAGCYPVVVQMVGPVAADYVMPLSAFRAPGWCGRDAPTIAQTLHAVQRVEVTANDEPEGPVRFSVGRIEFQPDDPTPRAPAARRREEPPEAVAAATAAAPPRPVAPAPLPSSAAAAPRRRIAAAAPPSPVAVPPPAAPRHVVCEFSARYQLMLCY